MTSKSQNFGEPEIGDHGQRAFRILGELCWPYCTRTPTSDSMGGTLRLMIMDIGPDRAAIYYIAD